MPHDDVCIPGFVLQRDEGYAARSAGALATGDEAGNTDVMARSDCFQISCAGCAFEQSTQQAKRVRVA